MRRLTGASRSLWLALLLAAVARAQTFTPLPVFDLERLHLNPSTEGALTVGTGELLPAGTWKVSLWGHYEHRPLLFLREGRVVEVVSGRTTATVTGAYSFLDWLELDASLPL